MNTATRVQILDIDTIGDRRESVLSACLDDYDHNDDDDDDDGKTRVVSVRFRTL